MTRRILAVVLALCTLAPPAALAHQRLVSATPAEGDSLDRAPVELRLVFDQPVEPALAALRLVGPRGEVALGPLTVPADSPTVLVARITAPLASGGYTVRWLVTGADGHPVRGEYAFAIETGAVGLATNTLPPVAGARADPGPQATPREGSPADHPPAVDGTAFDSGSPLYAAVRWLTFAGLLAAIGTVSFALLLLGSLRRREPAAAEEALDRARTRAASVGLVAGAVLAVALVLRFLAQSAALHGPAAALGGASMAPMLTRTLWGWGWMLQAAGTAALLVGLGLARRGRPGGWTLAAAAALALAATPALSGHAAAASAGAMVADALHVLAAAGWMGTLLLIVAVGLPVLRRAGGSGAGAALALLRAFSPLALSFAALLVLSGVYGARAHLPDLPALWTSAYGRTLLLKLGAVSLLLATGLYNWRRATPALERSGDAAPLRRSAAAELAVGALVLAVTAALVATPPPEAPAAPRAASATTPAPGSTP